MTRVFSLAVAVLSAPSFVVGLSAGDTKLAKARLLEALAPPSGKLSLCPEIIIPEPSDPTALLLQATAVNAMSEKIRSNAKANAAWISGTINSLKTFCSEQETARGGFPSPLPVVYCPLKECSVDELEDISDAGASGVMLTVKMDEISSDEVFSATVKSLLQQGLNPIPEVVLEETSAASFTEDDVTSLVSTLEEIIGSEPASVLLTVRSENEEEEHVSLPSVPNALGKRVPILGSVAVNAGENRISQETARLKEAGFTGAVLRADCLPGFRMNPDLEAVGGFWSACIGDLKSTRSKSFSFRAANNMEKSVPLEWAKYQNDVVDSGALGDMNDNFSEVDSSSGEYKGF